MKTENDQTAALVERPRAGETCAYDALVRRFQDTAVGYARALLGGDAAAAEDAAQEALVEAYRCLPALREPRAFPAWLRRIVFKRCDRIRRVRTISTVPLDAAAQAAAVEGDPERRVLVGERAALVHAAIAALPPGEREAVTLFYLADSTHSEAAAFLGIPTTTIKSRLHAARGRLRKELWDIMEETLKNERPSRDDQFAERVLADILAVYERQFRADPKTADRGLLADARAKLEEALAQPTLTVETVRAGRALLERQRDFDALAALLARYLRQDLSVSEQAWARWWHVWALTATNRADETIVVQTDFCRWAETAFSENTPRLSADWPFLPQGDGAPGEVLDASALPIWVLGIPQQAILWREAGRAAEWMRLAEAALEAAGRTPGNRLERFHLLRTIAELIHAPAGRLTEARVTIAKIAEIADEETDPVAAERWRLEERTTMVHHLAAQGDAAQVRTIGEEVLPRLDALERHFAASGEAPPWWLKTFQHNAACSLAGAKAYDLALPLFEKVVERGRGIGYAYLRLASVVWATTRDRARTLSLLKEAAARDARDQIPLMRDLPEFADVLEEPDFIAAARRP